MRSQKIRVGTVVIISLIMAALRTFIVACYMEKTAIASDTYYLSDNSIVLAFTTVSILFSLVFIYLGFASGRGKTVHLERSHGAVPASALILAFALFGATLFYAVSLIRKPEEFNIFEFAVLSAALLSAIKFVISGLNYNKKLKNENAHAAAALVPILLSALRILTDFINTSSAPTASSGAYHIVGLVAVLLYFLSEGKSYVIETSAAAFNSFGFVSIFYLLVYSLPHLVLHCFGTFSFDISAAFSVVDLGLVVYIAARLSSSKIEPKKQKEQAAEPSEEQL